MEKEPRPCSNKESDSYCGPLLIQPFYMWCVFTPTNINHHYTIKKQQDKNPEESGIQFPTLAGKLEMELGAINLSSPLSPSALRIQVK